MLTVIVGKINGVVYGLLEKVGVLKVHEIDAPANLKAILLTIRKCEGTAGKDGYRTMFTGKLFTSYASHPNQVFTSGGLRSNAAGAYQFMKAKSGGSPPYGFPDTWGDCVKALGLTDFTPDSQDKAAIYLIKRRKAFDDVLAGRIDSVMEKLSYEWASIPPFRYPGQGSMTKEKFRQFFKDYGGTIA
jgi:muramidase (phage lysozyme)